jgi:hypothetical protein
MTNVSGAASSPVSTNEVVQHHAFDVTSVPLILPARSCTPGARLASIQPSSRKTWFWARFTKSAARKLRSNVASNRMPPKRSRKVSRSGVGECELKKARRSDCRSQCVIKREAPSAETMPKPSVPAMANGTVSGEPSP